uniref:Cyclic nucleotide-binding domain-containing protein n=2 Tax=Heterosigma akashiwo TaxID=2829 RepID=A0A6V2WMT9_HETAK
MTTVGYGDITPQNDMERGYVTVAMFVGATAFGYIIGTVSNLMAQMKRARQFAPELIAMTSEYLSEQKVEYNLTKSIKKHLQYVFEIQSAFNENAILRRLPRDLRRQTLLWSRKDIIGEIHFFDGRSTAFVTHIARYMEPLFTPSTGFAYSQEEGSGGVYFLTEGIIEVVERRGGGPDGPPLTEHLHLVVEKGEVFGYERFLRKELFPHGARAFVDCCMFLLSTEEIIYMNERHKSLSKKLKKALQDYMDAQRKKRITENFAKSPSVKVLEEKDGGAVRHKLQAALHRYKLEKDVLSKLELSSTKSTKPIDERFGEITMISSFKGSSTLLQSRTEQEEPLINIKKKTPVTNKGKFINALKGQKNKMGGSRTHRRKSKKKTAIDRLDEDSISSFAECSLYQVSNDESPHEVQITARGTRARRGGAMHHTPSSSGLGDSSHAGTMTGTLGRQNSGLMRVGASLSPKLSQGLSPGLSPRNMMAAPPTNASPLAEVNDMDCSTVMRKKMLLAAAAFSRDNRLSPRPELLPRPSSPVPGALHPRLTDAQGTEPWPQQPPTARRSQPNTGWASQPAAAQGAPPSARRSHHRSVEEAAPTHATAPGLGIGEGPTTARSSFRGDRLALRRASIGSGSVTSEFAHVGSARGGAPGHEATISPASRRTHHRQLEAVAARYVAPPGLGASQLAVRATPLPGDRLAQALERGSAGALPWGAAGRGPSTSSPLHNHQPSRHLSVSSITSLPVLSPGQKVENDIFFPASSRVGSGRVGSTHHQPESQALNPLKPYRRGSTRISIREEVKEEPDNAQ